jgi:hypothetical protein
MVIAVANVMVCKHFFVAVDSDEEDCCLALVCRSRYNAWVYPNHPPAEDERVVARVAGDLQHVLVHIVVSLNVYASVNKEVNVKVNETDALSTRAELKDADRDGPSEAETDRSIWSLVFYTLAHSCLGPHGRMQNLDGGYPEASLPPTDRRGGRGHQSVQHAMKWHAARN